MRILFLCFTDVALEIQQKVDEKKMGGIIPKPPFQRKGLLILV